MNGTDWKELEAAWQSLPASATPAIEELKRARQLEWWSRSYVVGEILMTIAGLAAAAWLLMSGDTYSLAMGFSTILFVAAAAFASWWGRQVPSPRAEDPVTLAIATAIARIEKGLRLARASLWCVGAAQLYLAVFAATITLTGAAKDHASGYVAMALALVWLSLVLAISLIYIQRRSADLAALKLIEAELRD